MPNLYRLNPGAMQEFRAATSTATAEERRNSGAAETDERSWIRDGIEIVAERPFGTVSFPSE